MRRESLQRNQSSPSQQAPVQRRAGGDAGGRASIFDFSCAASASPVQLEAFDQAIQRLHANIQAAGGEPDAAPSVQQAAAHGTSGAGGRLPHFAAVQQAFGAHDIGGVQAHVGGVARQGAEAMGAEAYASGNHVAFREAPDLHTAAHEAAHVVQQRAGVQLAGGVGKVGDAYEQHADQVADAVVQGKSAEGILDAMAGGGKAGGKGGVQHAVQRAPQVIDGGGASGYTPASRNDVPDATRIALWEEFISNNFSPVAQALVRHYMHGKGALYTPTKKEMQFILAVPASDVSVTRTANFNKLLVDLMKRAKATHQAATQPITNAVVQAEQCAPNTLGGFRVTFNGKLVSTGANWTYVGTIKLYDEWDFDIATKSLKAFQEQAAKRGNAGQFKTLVGAAALPGKSFKFEGTATWSEASSKRGVIM